METDHLVHQLARGAGRATRLRPPLVRTLTWLFIALPYVVMVVLVMRLRPDLSGKLSDVSYIIEQLAALTTAVTAGFAAFASTIPGYDRRTVLLPLVPFLVWVGSLGAGCLRSWIVMGPDGLSLHPDWLCFPAIVIVGLVPAIALVIMLRRGAPLAPHVTSALAGLAAAGLGDFGLRFFHPQDASVMVLTWQMGTVLLLMLLASQCGRLLFNWRRLLRRAGGAG